jgi:hypothetical protein
MNREEKIEFILIAIEDIEEVSVTADYFKDYTDEQLDKEVEKWDYLYGK